MASIAQGAKAFNRRHRVSGTCVDVVVNVLHFVTQATHAGEILNAREVVVAGEHAPLPSFRLGCQSLSAVKQETPPAVGERVLDETEYVIIAARMLQRRNIHQIATQHDAAMPPEPLAGIFKDKVIFATNVFVA